MTRRTADATAPHCSSDQLRLIRASLKRLGLTIVGNKVRTADMRRVFGAVMKVPEWIVLHDYQSTVSIPQNIIDYVQVELASKYRALLPTSMKYADFGSFLTKEASPVVLSGVVFQYSIENSPRNVCFGYKLLSDAVLAENNGISTVEAAKAECMEAARQIIETKLYDL